MAPHSSTLAWKVPWTEEPGRLQSMGLLRVRHNWVTSLSLFTFMHWRRKWQPTPVFLPGGLPSVGSHRVRHDWSDLAAAAAVKESNRTSQRRKLWDGVWMMGAGPRWKDRGDVQGKLSSAHPGVAGQERKGAGGGFRWSGTEDDGFKLNCLSSSHLTMTDAGSTGQSPSSSLSCLLLAFSLLVCACVCTCARVREQC